MKKINSQSYNDFRKSLHNAVRFDLTGLVIGVQYRLNAYLRKNQASNAIQRWVYSDVLEALLIKASLEYCKSAEYLACKNSNDKLEFLEPKLLVFSLEWLTPRCSDSADSTLIKRLTKTVHGVL